MNPVPNNFIAPLPKYGTHCDCLIAFTITVIITDIFHVSPTTTSVVIPYHAAKGRTNIELREHFILPEGVSQSMSPFKPKRSASVNQRPVSLQSNTGPIVKVSIFSSYI